MSQLTHDYSFPSVMREKLQAVRWRKAGLSAVRAVAMAGAVLLLAAGVAAAAVSFFFPRKGLTTLVTICWDQYHKTFNSCNRQIQL